MKMHQIDFNRPIHSFYGNRNQRAGVLPDQPKKVLLIQDRYPYFQISSTQYKKVQSLSARLCRYTMILILVVYTAAIFDTNEEHKEAIRRKILSRAFLPVGWYCSLSWNADAEYRAFGKISLPMLSYIYLLVTCWWIPISVGGILPSASMNRLDIWTFVNWSMWIQTVS